jgi:nucleotide-binding universal stress UspA family protein
MSASQVFSRVLWASEGRGDEAHTNRCVRALCERYSCELWIVHVVPTILPGPMPELELHGGEERAIAGLKARTRLLRWRGVDASLHVIRGVVGSPAPAIVQVAGAVGADLIVLRAHERRPADSIGTVARLLASSPCPLLVFPSDGCAWRPPARGSFAASPPPIIAPRGPQSSSLTIM